MPNWFLDETCEKVWNRKGEHHYKISHIEINVATKFRLKLTLDFFDQVNTKKGISELKKRKLLSNSTYSN